MNELAEFHDELRAVARDLLAGAGAGDDVWRRAVEVGWPGLEVAGHCDGAGATFAETAVVLEEIGRAAAPLPLFGGTLALAATDDEDVSLAIARGARMAVSHDPAAFTVTARGDGIRLDGRAEFVAGAAGAESLLLVASTPQPAVIHVPVNAVGITVTDQPLLDESRGFGTVCAESVVLAGADATPLRNDAQHVFDRGALAIAIDSLGVAEAMTAATVGYVKVREQFGRVIGSFQAVKHACADMAVKNAVSRALIEAAIEAHVAGAPDASRAVSMAKSFTCGAAVEVVGSAMQLHGGVGYTWESGVHAYLKRAALNRSLFGSATEHRRRLATRYA